MLCCVSTGTSAQNKTGKHTQTNEHHSSTEELLEDFFKDYGDGNGNIIASQLCNFTQKLSGCSTAKASSDGHDGHDHGEERTEVTLVERTNETEEHHDDEEGGPVRTKRATNMGNNIHGDFETFSDRKSF